MDNNRVVAHINHKDWWRTALPDERTLNERGLFLASSFCDAEFYGSPLDVPFRVTITSPLFGDEAAIMQTLGLQLTAENSSIEERFAQDAEMLRIGFKKGFDSIALVTHKAYQRFENTGHIPGSIELQVFCTCGVRLGKLLASERNTFGKWPQFGAGIVVPS